MPEPVHPRLKAANFMTKKVITIGRHEPIRNAWILMEKCRIHHLPVVEEGKLVGIISDKDLDRALPSITEFKDREKLKLVLNTVSVDLVMSRPVRTITPDSDVRMVAGIFMENKFRCFPVMANGALVGIVTATDLLRFFARLKVKQYPTPALTKRFSQQGGSPGLSR